MFYFLIIISILLFSAGLAGFSSAPWVPTKKKDVKRFLDIANIAKGDVVYDLGCGDGRILRAAKSRGANPIGLEISILNYLYCKVSAGGAKIKFKNFFYNDFSDADVVFMFLSQRSHNAMAKILKSQMKPGGKIVCYVWPIEGWTPEKIDKAQGSPKLYLYRV